MKKLFSTLIALVLFATVLPAATWAAPRQFPSWDKKFTNGRFTVLAQFGGAAVLDKETGIVWEQSPDTGTRIWADGLAHCYQREVGGRRGWRLPTIEELTSIVDTTNASPTFPSGHPFTLTSEQEEGVFLSATTFVGFPSAWIVRFLDALIGGGDKSNPFFAWCVRGGQGIDGVQ